MIKNYFQDAFRNIRKHKGYSFINISSLTLGITCFILMLMWVQDELSFDRFHENANEIFRVIVKNQIAEKEIHNVRTPNALGAALKSEFPEIIDFTRTQGVDGWIVQYGENKFRNDIIAIADPSFFKIFTFPFIKGNPDTVFNNDASLVVTENFAKKYFGADEPMNKVINISGKDFTVTGVIKNVPSNSHIWFDCIFPINNMKAFWGANLESWKGNSPFYTYILLRKNASWKEVSNKISGVVKKQIPGSKIDLYLQPLKDVHLKSKFEGDLDNYKQGNIDYIYIISTIALCILFIACFNFMNLSVARSADRAKGIAIRKVNGASRMNILIQFLGEAIILSFIALIFALFLVYLLLPVFNDLSGKHLTYSFLGRITFILELIILTIVTGIIAGSYPAFFLSSFEPVNILKRTGSSFKKKGGYFRKALVITQFAIAAILTLGTIVVYSQLSFIKTKDLGFNAHNVVNFFSAHQIEENFEEKKALFMSNPNVLNFCMGDVPIALREPATDNVNWDGKKTDEKITMYPCHIDYGYIELYNIKIVEGRSFSREFSTDASSFILNETAVKEMGIKSPVGKRLWFNGKEGIIIGVVKDYHHNSLHSKIIPLVLMLPYEFGMASVRIHPVNISETYRFLEETWKKINKSPYPFIANFADETVDNLYKAEQRMGTIAKYSTFFVIFISCLGLLGLASYTSRQRTKEIGIRKICGASISGIVFLLSKAFIKWICVALIIASPLAWYIMYRWLENYAYRINIELWMFLLTGATALIIAFLTVSYQVLKAASVNPIESLRYE